MHLRLIRRSVAVAAGAALAVGGTALAAAAPSQAAGHHGDHSGVKHVLLISVDGLHQQDLAWYVRHNPHSVLAALDRQGVEYSHARNWCAR